MVQRYYGTIAITSYLLILTSDAISVPSPGYIALMDVGISQFLCYNIDPFAQPHVEHNCVEGPPCLAPGLFAPTQLSTDQWVSTAKLMGANEVCLTAHHEGGFCLWPSQHSNYSVAQSPWGGTGRDLVAEFVQSCRKYAVRPCFYWGPNANGHLLWEGATNETFITTYLGYLRELLTNYGPIARLWWDHYEQGEGGREKLAPCPQGSFPTAWSLFIQEVRDISPSTIICPGPDCTGHLGEQGTGGYPVWYACDPVPCVGNASMDCGCNIKAHSPTGSVFKPLETCSTPYVNHQWFASGTGEGQIAWNVSDFWQSWRTSVGIGYVNTMNSAPGTTGRTYAGLVSVQSAFGYVLAPLALNNALAGSISSTNPPIEWTDEKRGRSTEIEVAPLVGACAQFVVELPVNGSSAVGAVVIREDLRFGQSILSYVLEYQLANSTWAAFPSCRPGSFTPGNVAMSPREGQVPFTVQHGVNNVYGEAKSKANTSSITYAGTFSSFAPCYEACTRAPSCQSFTWAGESGDIFANQCFLRNDTIWQPHHEVPDVSGYKGTPLSEHCVHGQSVGALLVDTLPRVTTNALRFRCTRSLKDPVQLRSISAHQFAVPGDSYLETGMYVSLSIGRR